MGDIEGTAEFRDPENRGPMASIIENLLEAASTDTAARDQLEQLLRDDDSALREYLMLVDLDARLRWAFRGGVRSLSVSPATVDVGQVGTGDRVNSSHEISGPQAIVLAQGTRADERNHSLSNMWRRARRRPAAVVGSAASLAAIVLIWVSVQFLLQRGTVGMLTQSAAAKWAEPNAGLRPGARLKAGKMELLSGVAEITLRNDTRLIVEGPAKYEIRSDMGAVLQSGTVSVFVGRSVSGYTLDSPDVKVIDLGTAFQLNVTNLGSDVHVIDGEVVAIAKKSLPGKSRPDEIRLAVRDAVRFSRRDGSVAAIEFAGGRLKLRGQGSSLSAMPVAVTGDIHCLEQPPESVAVGDLEDDDWMHLFVERSDLTLMQPVYPDRNAKGEDAVQLGTAKLRIPAGTRLNSYLLHYDTANESGDFTLHRVSGTITFRTPIVGVFFRAVGLYTSDKVFRSESTKYRPDDEGFGARSLDKEDFFSFSPDRKTIIVNLQANTGADHIRIITLSEQSE